MAVELSIRRYEAGDKDAVWRLHERAYRHALDEFYPQLDRDFRHTPPAYLDDGEFLVGTLEGQIVAIGGFQPVESDAVEIRRMRVNPDLQRRGYATAILNAFEARASRRGFDRAVLLTSELLSAAVAFYRAADYRVVEREPHPETDLDLIRFEKSLR